jgi:putative ABC transport system permease protein
MMLTLQDIRYALRMLRVQPGFSIVAVVTLALGIAAATTVFSAVDSLLLRPPPLAQPDRLVLVWGTNMRDGQPRDVIAGPNYIDLQRQNSTFDGFAAFHLNDMPVRVDGGVGVVGEMSVTPEFFTTLGVQPILGRTFESGDGLPGRNQVVLLGYGFWQQRFGGDPNVVGRTLAPLGQPHTIVGVLPPDFQFFTSPEVATPLVPSALEQMPRTNHYYWVVGRLKAGVSRAQAEADLDAIMRRVGIAHPALRNWEVTLDPLQGTLTEPVRPALLVLLTAAAVLVLIGCANVASLLLARGMDRRGEFAVRTALGASRGRLIVQSLAESLVLASIAGALGVLVTGALVAGLTNILPTTVAIPGSAALVALPPVAIDTRVLLFATLLSVATVLLFAVLPALRQSPAQPQNALQASAIRIAVDHNSRRVQRALIFVETALATVLLIAAGLMVRTIANLLRTDPGFQPKNVVAMYVGGVEELDDEARARYFSLVIDRVRAVGGVAAAGLNDYVLLQNEDDYQGLVPEGRPLVQESVRREEWRRISPGYFEAMRIALLRGRHFTDADHAKVVSVAIVNEAMARKYWPGEDAVGKRLLITHAKFRWTEIVGLVSDERTVGIELPAKPMLYVPFQRAPRPVMGLVVRTEGDPRERLAAVQQAVWSVDRTRPVYGTVLLEDLVSDAISVQRLTAVVSLSVAGTALALTAVGLFAVVRYAVAQRTREFGIRAALGARPRDLHALVLRDELWVTCGGVVLGAAVSAGIARGLSRLLYGVAPIDPATFIAVGVLLLAISSAACWLPARRATRVDPMVALRYE